MSGERVGISNFCYMGGLFDGLQYYVLANYLLANVNSRSRSRSLYAIALPSVCRLSACLSSGGSNFRQYFYGNRYRGHPLTFTKNLGGVKRKRGS